MVVFSAKVMNVPLLVYTRGACATRFFARGSETRRPVALSAAIRLEGWYFPTSFFQHL